MRFALIDLGTNSARLFIYERDGSGNITEIFRHKEMVQLGTGLFISNTILPDAKDRTLTAFRRFREEIDEHKVEKIHAITTCAMREAENSREVQDEITRETGIALEVISGAEEARLIATGILDNRENINKPHLCVDIGGGSTELTLIENNEIVLSKSFPLGAIRCQELFLKTVPPTSEAIDNLKEHITEITSDFRSEIRDFPKTILGSSGSIRALVLLIPDKNAEMITSTEKLRDLVKTMSKQSLSELEQYPFAIKKRAGIIVSSGTILLQLSELFKIKTIEAVHEGLKDGLIAELNGD